MIITQNAIPQEDASKRCIEMMTTDFDRYLSPFSWRYASEEMRRVWSETHKRRLWRSIWVALAQAQSEFGLVQPGPGG